MKYRMDLALILLFSLTFFMWLFYINAYTRLMVYGMIFVILIILKKPIYYYILVILFSVMADNIRKEYILVDYCLIILLFCFTLIKAIKHKKIIWGKLLIPLIIYTLYNIISLLWTPDLMMGIEGIYAILEGYLIYFVITNNKVKFTSFLPFSKAASFLLLTITGEIITKYLNYGFYNIIENKRLLHLGWANSNIMASLFPLLIPVALYKYVAHRKLDKLYLAIDSLNFCGLLLSLSRGAYLGVFIGLILFTGKFIRKVRRYVGVIMIILIVCFLFKDGIIRFITYYLDERNLFDSSNRKLIYRLAWDKFKESLLFGHGVKSSAYYIYHELGLRYAHYHNFALQIASTLGLVGISLLMLIVKEWYAILDELSDSFVYCVAVSIIGALTHQLFDVSFDLYFFGVYFYVLIGTIEVYRKNKVISCC